MRAGFWYPRRGYNTTIPRRRGAPVARLSHTSTTPHGGGVVRHNGGESPSGEDSEGKTGTASPEDARERRGRRGPESGRGPVGSREKKQSKGDRGRSGREGEKRKMRPGGEEQRRTASKGHSVAGGIAVVVVRGCVGSGRPPGSGGRVHAARRPAVGIPVATRRRWGERRPIGGAPSSAVRSAPARPARDGDVAGRFSRRSSAAPSLSALSTSGALWSLPDRSSPWLF